VKRHQVTRRLAVKLSMVLHRQQADSACFAQLLWMKQTLSDYCRMGLSGPTTSVGTRTDYSVGPWDYPACATWHLMAWSTRTTKELYSVKELYMFRTV
jgi:hypothetical protein